MDMNKLVKVVYTDGGDTKVLKGILIEEDIHTISLKLEHTNNKVMIGKAALVKVTYVDVRHSR